MSLLSSPAFFFVQPVLLALLSFFLYNVLDHWSLGSPLEIPSFGCPTHQSVLGITLAFYVSILFFSFFLGDFLSFYGVFVVLCLASFLFWLALLWSMEVFFWGGGEVHIYLGSVLSLLPQHTVSASLTIDLISFSFLFLTITIAVWVNVFAFSYFSYEPNVDSLLLLLNAFILSMGVLVIAGNLVVLFFGWEMIGLTSFLLINFWQTSVGTLKSAFKAYSFNKFSDSSLLLGLVYFYFILGDLDFSSMSLSLPPIAPVWSSGLCLVSPAEVAAFLFVCAASVKSAQAGFHVWLPDSMEAPVPASALIHSATLVSAGIFLLVRLQCLIELTWFVSSFVILIGAVTAFVGGFSALFQTDLNSILAYSTVSHCGFLFFLAVSGTLEHTLFYLYVHGFFKASSFLCVGSILRYTHGQQDVRRMGSLWKYLPAEFYFLLFCLSCLSGMPMFFGYSVKHLALGSSVPSIFGLVAGSVVLLAALAGLFYSHKILFFVFFDSKKGRKSAYLSAAGADLMSVYYSNTTLASNISIGALAGSAYFVSYLAASALSADSGLTLLGGASTFGYDLVAASAEVDVSLHFNFSLLNTLVCILFFFLNFFCWSSTSNLGYSLLCTLALAIVLS